MTTTTPNTARDRAIAELLSIRQSAWSDLTSRPDPRPYDEWTRDRMEEIGRCNAELDRLGYFATA